MSSEGQLHRGGRAQPNLPSCLASAAAALRGPRSLAPPGAGRHQGGPLVAWCARVGSAADHHDQQGLTMSLVAVHHVLDVIG